MRYRRSATCLWRSFGEEVLLARPDSDFRALSGTAAHVWSLLEEPQSPEEVADALAPAYRAPRDVVGRDVAALLGELVHLGYVDEVVDG